MITPDELHKIALLEAGDKSHAGCGLDCSRKRLAELAQGYIDARKVIATLMGAPSPPHPHTLVIVRGETAQPEVVQIGRETP